MFTEASGKPNVVFFLMLSWDIEIEHWISVSEIYSKTTFIHSGSLKLS